MKKKKKSQKRSKCHGRTNSNSPCWYPGRYVHKGFLYCKVHIRRLTSEYEPITKSELRALKRKYLVKKALKDRDFQLWCVDLLPELLQELFRLNKMRYQYDQEED